MCETRSLFSGKIWSQSSHLCPSHRCTDLVCTVRWLIWVNDFVQVLQVCGFSPVWVSRCRDNICLVEKTLLHCPQWKPPPRWTAFMCDTRCCFFVKLFWQCSQLCLSPRWTERMCCVRWPLWIKDLPQVGQVCGFSPVWVSRCRDKSCLTEKALLQCSQWNLFSASWTTITCRLRLLELV